MLETYFCFSCILNNDNLLNNETTSSSDNMQLANPEPRQVVKCAESSFMQPNLSPQPSLLSGIEYNKDLEKYAVVLLFSYLLENDNKHLDSNLTLVYLYLFSIFNTVFFFKCKI